MNCHRILLFLMLGVGTILLPCRTWALSVHLSDVVASAGTTNMVVSIEVDDAAGIAGGDLTLNYDSAVLRAQSVRGSVLLTSNGIALISSLKSGEIRISLAGATAIGSGQGELCAISFEILSDALPGNYSLDLSRAVFRDEQAQVLSVGNITGGQVKVEPESGPVSLQIRGFSGARQVASPLRTRVGRFLRFEVWAFTQSDSSDLEPVTDFTWQVPERLGEAAKLGQLKLTTVAGVSDSITFQARGAHAGFQIITVPSSIKSVGIEPADAVLAPGQQQHFQAQALDQYGNQVPGGSFGWYVVGDIGTINSRTGNFTASLIPGQGYVIAVARRAMVFGDIGTSVQGSRRVVVASPLPKRFVLYPNAPNPFNPETGIRYVLPVASAVELTVYDLMGQRVRVLVSGTRAAGMHEVVWDGRSEAGEQASNGVYFYRLQANSAEGVFQQMRRMLLLK